MNLRTLFSTGSNSNCGSMGVGSPFDNESMLDTMSKGGTELRLCEIWGQVWRACCPKGKLSLRAPTVHGRSVAISWSLGMA